MKREMYKAYLDPSSYSDVKVFYFKGYAHEDPKLTASREAVINGYGKVIKVVHANYPYNEV